MRSQTTPASRLESASPNFTQATRVHRKAKSRLAHACGYVVERLEDRRLLSVSIINGTAGSGYVGNGGGNPPDVTGAAGPNSYLEVTNNPVTLFQKATGTILAQHEISDFFYNPAIGN